MVGTRIYYAFFGIYVQLKGQVCIKFKFDHGYKQIKLVMAIIGRGKNTLPTAPSQSVFLSTRTPFHNKYNNNILRMISKIITKEKINIDQN
jgi:hypothetical protein